MKAMPNNKAQMANRLKSFMRIRQTTDDRQQTKRGFTRSVKACIARSAFDKSVYTHTQTRSTQGVSRAPGKTMQASTAGFTLIETLVAITVLLVALAGPLTIAQRGLTSALFARDQIIAFYLAQEAVEYIRNTRDNNILRGRSWLNGLNQCTNSSPCYIDVPNDTVRNCSSGTCPAIQFEESSGLYNHQTGDPSRFTRAVEITSVNDHEVAISVTINWRSGTLQNDFSIRENLLNWQ